jgi:hypothetical protein
VNSEKITYPLLSFSQLQLLSLKPSLTGTETLQQTDGTLASLSEVSWQTCFWITITLALNTMTKPCGKVCGMPSRYRIYLQSSPFVCLAGMVSILTKLEYFLIRSRHPLLKCVQLIGEECFQESEPEEGI